MYSHHYDNRKPRLLNVSKRATVRQKQLESDDPLVENIANEGNIDIDYLRMMDQIENKVHLAYLPANCELRKVSRGINNISLVEMVMVVPA